jgi:hypothetical protein
LPAGSKIKWSTSQRRFDQFRLEKTWPRPSWTKAFLCSKKGATDGTIL